MHKTRDKEGLNRIILYCGNVSSGIISSKLDSNPSSSYGVLSQNYSCPAGLDLQGFQLGVPTFNFSLDNTGCNCINFKCSMPKNTQADYTYPLTSKGRLYQSFCWTDLTNFVYCKRYYVGICGMRIKVQEPKGEGLGFNATNDDTAINDIQFKCCDYVDTGDIELTITYLI